MHIRTGLAGAALGRLDERSFRPLRRAVLGSLALHALVFAALSLWMEPGALRPPALPLLRAHLAKPKPPPTPPVVPPRVEPPRPAKAPAAKSVKPAPPPVVAPPAAAREPVKPVPALAAPAPAAAVAVPPAAGPVPASPAPSAVASVPASPATPAAAGPDPGNVARFRLELMDVARRYKRYPRIAQDNNWEGRVELRLAYAENGTLASMTVKKSAGRQVLDDEAMAMLRSAQAQVAPPAALRGKSFTLEIPVDFNLRD